jgi:hypothetical protein
MEYTERRLTYIQVQSMGLTGEIVAFISVRPYAIENGIPIDAPLSEEKNYSFIIESGQLFTNVQDYFLSLIEEE